MKRKSLKVPAIILILVILIVKLLDNENILYTNQLLDNILWLVVFPIVLIISYLLFIFVYKKIERYKEIQRESFSRKSFRLVGEGILVFIQALLPVLIIEAAIGVYINGTAKQPLVLFFDKYEIEKVTGWGRYPLICTTKVKIHSNIDTNYLCMERILGLPSIESGHIMVNDSTLCIAGRESQLGVAVDKMATIPNKGLNLDAKKHRCAQLFGAS